MLSLQKIIITQFKNYEYTTFNFNERVIGICGLNGRGKTNLLDAIYYCCFTKSYFSSTDLMNTNFTKDGFRLEALFFHTPSPANDHTDDEIICIYRGTGKKEVLLNNIIYTKLSSHIGKFPVVMIAPDDIELITGSSEIRRRFIDTMLCQMNSEYLQQLILYNKILLQRNSALKRFGETGKTDLSLLEVLDEQLQQPGNYIYSKRKALTAALIPLVQKFYTLIAGDIETVTLQYDSRLNEMIFGDLLKQLREKDLLLQRSNTGIHKDDLQIQLNHQNFKNTASQGQRKSLLFALKLAEFELLKMNKGFAPVLLLDDVFEKLDIDRMNNLLYWVCNENSGQVFITDTHKERLAGSLEILGMKFQIIEL